MADNAGAEEIGLKIAQAADEQAKGFGNFTARQTMVLRNKHGQESRRSLRIKGAGRSRTTATELFVFDEPRDVEGTAFLIHSHMWRGMTNGLLACPETGQAHQFVQSLGVPSWAVNFPTKTWAHRMWRSIPIAIYAMKPCGELTCTVSERFPTDKKSVTAANWSGRIGTELRTWRVEYYDRKDAHLKTLTLTNYGQYLDNYWYAGDMTMINHLTGKSTDLTWTEYQFRTDLDDRDFTQTGLKRVR